MRINKIILFILFIFLSSCISKNKLGIVVYEKKGRVPTQDLIMIQPEVTQYLGAPYYENFLINTNGEILKSWKLPTKPINSKIDHDGSLYSLMLALKGEKISFIPGECGKIIKTWPSGKQETLLDETGLSHDFEILDNNQLATFQLELIEPQKNKRIKPSSNLKKLITYWADQLVIFDKNRKPIWIWRVLDHFDEIGDPNYGQIYRNGGKWSTSNGNSIQFIKENPLSKKPSFLLSFRNLDRILLIEYPSGKILWSNPKGSSTAQHDATMRDHSVLVYDNNIYDFNSRIKEWDIQTNNTTINILPAKFLSNQVMGGVRYLSNGNLLISNSTTGQLMEITKSGEMVWSFLIKYEQKENQSSWPLGTPFYRAEIYPQDLLKKLN